MWMDGWFKSVLTARGKEVEKWELKAIINIHNVPSVLDASLYSVDFWDSMGVKLHDLMTKKDSVAPHKHMLPIFRVILETPKAAEKHPDAKPATTSQTETAPYSSNPGSGIQEGSCLTVWTS